MSLTIEQKPKYRLIPAASNIIFTVKDDVTTASKFKIKYTAEVYVHNRTSGLTNTVNRVAVLKVTPNGVGSGIFDLSPILQNYVTPDYEGGTVHNSSAIYFSQYNGVDFSDNTPHTIHQIDDFSTNRNSCRFFTVRFNVEAADSATGSVTTQYNSNTTVDDFLIYNGVLYDTDILNLDSKGNFGYNLGIEGFVMNSSTDSFLSNAPKTQYLRTTDYLTLSFFSQYDWDFEVGTAGALYPSVRKIEIQFYNNGSTTGSLITKLIQASTGGHSGYMGDSNNKLQFAGVGTGNLVGSGETLPTNWDYYTVKAKDIGNNVISDTYNFYKQEEDCKEFETIRLTWLNKFGVWDYYNFTKKSVRTFNTKRKSYTQITGTWNESKFRINGHTGGKKTYNSSISETIKLNTDYITEAEAIWLEELFISNDVYILETRSTDNTSLGYMRKYIQPATITNSTHTRKTKANDKLIQYTFNLQTTKTKKTQRI
tara:strand:- start:828 stop:2270 length:1443 start_codon:yes stop_codon:yes gene_type:complete